MAAIDAVPLNKNFLNPQNFTFVLKRAPNLSFFVQEINLPGIAVQALDIASPLQKLPQTGIQPIFNDLAITFKVDEDFENYAELYNWIKRITAFNGLTDYTDLSGVSKATGEWVKSDISLIIGNSAKNPNFEVTFIDAFPMSISDLYFRYTDQDVNYVTATTVFKYTQFSFTKL